MVYWFHWAKELVVKMLFEVIKNNPDIDEKDYEIAVNKFSNIIGSYILEDS